MPFVNSLSRGIGTCTVEVVARYPALGYIRLSLSCCESISVSGASRSVAADGALTSVMP